MKRSKAYDKGAEQIDKDALYSPLQAVRLAKSSNPAKFDATVEVAFRLGVDPRKADQMVRGTVALPSGTGKDVRIAVFAQGDAATAARGAGADHVGADDLVKLVEGGMLDFDVAIATPDLMPVVGKLGRVLGPRGLMPNPKTGTVTFDVTKAIKEIKAGKVEYRVDKTGIIHAGVGKISFGVEKLGENAKALIDAVNKAKPPAAKGKYVKAIHMASTMGPSVAVSHTVVEK
jgi:large subunit ribosomal protein L1